MNLQKLILTDFRGFKQITLPFQPGVNLIAGVNGSGKSSILKAICLLLQRALLKTTLCREPISKFVATDIRHEYASCLLNIEFQIRDEPYSYYLHSNRTDWRSGKAGEVRHQTIRLHNREGFTTQGPIWLAGSWLPFALFFSPSRSVLNTSILKGDTDIGSAAIYGEALNDRPLRIERLAAWWGQQITFSSASDVNRKRVSALAQALETFLPEFEAIRPVTREVKGRSVSSIEAVKSGIPLDVGQLSDGERGMIALVAETARRLSLAYSKLEDPIREGEAVILVDEIELHLHPRWQREIIQRLEKTFPKCQFIITTHSPQVLGEVDNVAVLLIEDGNVFRPSQTYGMSSNWILSHVMNTEDRDRVFEGKLREIASLLSDSTQLALQKITEIESRYGLFPELQSLKTKAEVLSRVRR